MRKGAGGGGNGVGGMGIWLLQAGMCSCRRLGVPGCVRLACFHPACWRSANVLGPGAACGPGGNGSGTSSCSCT